MYSPRKFTRIPYMNKSNAPKKQKAKKGSSNLRVPSGSSAAFGFKTIGKPAFVVSAGPVLRVRGERQVQTGGQHGTLTGSSKPDIAVTRDRNGDQRSRIRHREYVADLAGSVAFGVESIAINPGLQEMFPWLSGIAQNYESYHFNQLVFQYRTQASSATPGKAMLAVDYDAADDVPDNKTELMQNRTKGDGPVWLDFDVSCDQQDLSKFAKERYIRRSPTLPANVDIKTYDVGQLFSAAQDQANTNKIGELFVLYDVTLMTPATPNLEFQTAPGAAKITSGGTVNLNNSFGSVPTILQTLDPIVNAGANILNINNPGNYLLQQTVTGTGVSSAPTLSGTATTLIQSFIKNNSSGATQGDSTFLINTTEPNQTAIFDYSNSLTTLTSSLNRIADWSSLIA